MAGEADEARPTGPAAVCFILGRSGSGKTHYCVASVRDELSAATTGAPLLLLVPEQATFQMEQALLSDERLEGYHRARVTSFLRLARQLLAEGGGGALPLLSENAKQMLLGRLLQEHAGALRIFGGSAGRSGFVAQLSRMLSELRQYRQTPASLRAQGERLRAEGDAVDSPLAAKLADLALIYEVYLAALRGRFTDPDHLLDLAARSGAAQRLLNGVRVWIDGFADFTPQQLHFLAVLFRVAERVEMSICLDPHSTSFRQVQTSGAPPIDDTDLFYLAQRTYARVDGVLRRLGVRPERALCLPAADTMPRFAREPMLAQIEQRLYEGAGGQGAGDAGQMPATGAVVVTAPDRRAEVVAVAEQIRRRCREQGYRYRDVAVICRETAPYEELIEAVFADYGIAYFIDRRRPVRHHPLVELIRSGLAVLAGGFRRDAVFDYLKTDLAGADRAAVDALENAALARGIDGGRWRSTLVGSDAETTELEAVRQAALGPLLAFESAGGRQADEAARATVRTWAEALFGLLERLEVGATLARWSETAAAEGRLDEADVHRQVYGAVLELLDDLVEVLGAQAVTLGQFGEILNAALGSMTLALVPPALDQVLVGAIERSRHPQIRAAFVIGVNVGAFPKVGRGDSLLTDAQREQLRGQDCELAPASTQRLLQERYLGYIALTRPQEFLWVSHPVSDEAGTSLLPSPLVDAMLRAAPQVPRVMLARAEDNALEGIETAGQLGLHLAAAWESTAGSAGAVACYRLAAASGLDAVTAAVTRGVDYVNEARLDGDVQRRLRSPVPSFSVSRLETFASCPFQYFSRHVLRLQERDRLQLEAVDLGSFYHEALRRCFEQLQAAGEDWGTVAAADLRARLRRIGAALRDEPPLAALVAQAARYRHLLAAAQDRLESFGLTLRAMAAAGAFRQVGAELEYGPDKPLGPLTVTAGPHGAVTLRGKIDRLDACFAPDGGIGLLVIDFKSRMQPFSYDKFYHGLALQLTTYLLVAVQRWQGPGSGPPEAAATLFCPIQGESVKSKGDVPGAFVPPDDEAVRSRSVRGLISRPWLEALDKETAPGHKSTWFGFSIKQDGDVGRRAYSPVVAPEEMTAVLAHTQRQLAALAERVLGGEIAVRPYRLMRQSPCTYCPFRAVCRFDPRVEPYRYLGVLGRDAVLEACAAAEGQA